MRKGGLIMGKDETDVRLIKHMVCDDRDGTKMVDVPELTPEQKKQVSEIERQIREEYGY